MDKTNFKIKLVTYITVVIFKNVQLVQKLKLGNNSPTTASHHVGQGLSPRGT